MTFIVLLITSQLFISYSLCKWC